MIKAVGTVTCLEKVALCWSFLPEVGAKFANLSANGKQAPMADSATLLTIRKARNGG